MKPIIAVFLAAICAGCTKGPDATDAHVARPVTDLSGSPTSDTTSPQSASAYPEKAEVEALLYRARELQGKKQFDSALALVEKALQADPYSPSAKAMKQRLEEIMKRIREDSPT